MEGMIVEIGMGICWFVVDGGLEAAMGKEDMDVQERNRGC